MRNLVPYIVISALIALLDLAAGIHITLWAVLLFPLALATWNLGRSRGGLIAILCFALTVIVWWIQPAPAHLVRAINVMISHAIVYWVVWALVGKLREREVERIFLPQSRQH